MRVTILAGLACLSFLPALARADQACVPDCRSGYVCVGGTCVSACNPPCAAGERCTAEGECVPAPASPTAPSTATVTPTAGTPASVQTPAPQGTVSAVPAPAEPTRGFRHFGVGVAAGILFPGEAELTLKDDEDYSMDVDTDSGPALFLFVDKPLGTRFSIGGVLYTSAIEAENVDVSLLGVGFGAKGRFPLGTNLQLRPGLAVNYHSLTIEDGSDDDDATGVGVLASVELATAVGASTNVVTTLGFLTQPTGGNDWVDLTFGPTLFLTGGVEFGR